MSHELSRGHIIRSLITGSAYEVLDVKEIPHSTGGQIKTASVRRLNSPNEAVIVHFLPLSAGLWEVLPRRTCESCGAVKTA